MRLNTERLTIRYAEEKDLDRFWELQNDEFVLKYLCMWKMTKRKPWIISIR